MNPIKLLLAILTLPTCSFAQGTMLFTWHGDNNYFQASFQVTKDETLPGTIFNSSLFTNSIQVTSLDGLTYRATNETNPFIAGRFGPPLSLTFDLADENTFSVIQVAVVPGQGAAINEISSLPNGRNGESGFWSYEIIPEPSPVALSAVGLLALSKHKS